ARFQTNLVWDTLLELDGRLGPLHARLSAALREAIRDGRPPPPTPRPPPAPWPRAWLLALGRQRGLRPAGRRGLPGGPGRLRHPCPVPGPGRVDGLILEDDYDAEFRYDRRPVGTIQGTDPSRVALLGSLSKTLSPALGIGWAVTPPAWTGPFRAPVGAPAVPSTLDQLTFAAFLETGAYDRHLRAARKRFRRRHDRLVRGLAGPPEWERR